MSSFAQALALLLSLLGCLTAVALGIEGNKTANGQCLALMGVFTTAGEEAVRNMHRRYLGLFNSVTFQSCGPIASLLVRFVLCSKVLSHELLNEQEEHRDLLILPSTENMNDGKTLDYFGTIARHSFNTQFVLKSDIDAFVHADNLVSALGQISHSGQSSYVYYGRVIGRFPVPDHGWIMGCLYGMSYNLVQEFAVLAESRSFTLRGGEDKVSTRIAAKIASATNKTCTWVTDNFIHDHPDCGCGANSIPFTNNTVAVHQLKAYSLWNSTLQYFFGQESTKMVMQNLGPRNFPGLTYRTCHRILD